MNYENSCKLLKSQAFGLFLVPFGLAPSTIGKLYRNQVNRFDAHTLDTLCNYFKVSALTDLLEHHND
ncbi:MAG: helix-turn-helix transcriptional regulator [Nostoc indistinguendum CM1-VF10]|jgi:DNA-binding Xre family transcriptional regulator|nr:helix-turn-helix transcriptional regulator [Nostoc indistinguendum CM1-VF10]